MSILSRIFKSKLERVQEKSGKIFNVFTSTMQDLYSVNTEIDEEIVKREEVIKHMENEKTVLGATRDNNNKMISKIETFLND